MLFCSSGTPLIRNRGVLKPVADGLRPGFGLTYQTKTVNNSEAKSC